MVDTTTKVSNRGSLALAWILCLLFAAIAATGWYQFQDAREATRNLARISEAQIEDLENRLQQYRKTNAELQAEVASERQSRIKEVSRLTASSAELESELQHQLTQQESLNLQIGAVNNEKQQLEGRLEEAQSRRQQLLDQLDEINGDVEAKAAALAAADADILELKRQLEQTHRQQQMLEARIELLIEQQRKEAEHFASLKQQLETELSESRVKITQMENRMTVINLTSEVLFRTGSARITASGRKLLDVIAASLNEFPDRAISIEGHTDNVPVGDGSSFASNWELSAARALAAVDYLQQDDRIAASRLQVVGHGEHQPVASNDTAEGRQMNRRIEIRLLPSADFSS